MPASLITKLQLKAGQSLRIENTPAGLKPSLVADLPGIRVTSGKTDAVLLFVSNLVELRSHAPKLLKSSPLDAIVWIAYPKGTSALKSDINRDKLRETLESTGWRTVRLIALDDTWSVMRLRSEALVRSRAR